MHTHANPILCTFANILSVSPAIDLDTMHYPLTTLFVFRMQDVEENFRPAQYYADKDVIRRRIENQDYELLAPLTIVGSSLLGDFKAKVDDTMHQVSDALEANDEENTLEGKAPEPASTRVDIDARRLYTNWQPEGGDPIRFRR